MIFDFPLKDYIFREVTHLKEGEFVSKLDDEIELNQRFFRIKNESFGTFQVENGKTVVLKKNKIFNQKIASIYLNGSVFSAILHQRKFLHLHTSSFALDGKAILICGDSEVGKSTTALNFCINGANFLTDDIAPIVFDNFVPKVISYSKKFKIWNDAFEKLNLINEGNEKIFEEDEKYFLEFESSGHEVEIAYIFILEIGEVLKTVELIAVQKFEALREQIFRKEYLEFMPETEISYLKQVSDLSQKIKVFQIIRPFEVDPLEIKKIIENILKSC